MKSSTLFIVRFSIAAIGISIVSSCGTSNNASLQQANEPPSFASSMAKTLWVENAPPQGMTTEQYQYLRKQYWRDDKYDNIGFKNWIKSAEKESDWHVVENEGRSVVERVRGKEQVFIHEVHRFIAANMLREFLLAAPPTIEVQKAMGYYLDLLVEHNYFKEPKILADALPRMRGYWSDSKITATARACVEYNDKNEADPFWRYFKEQAKAAVNRKPDQYEEPKATYKLAQKLMQEHQQQEQKIKSSSTEYPFPAIKKIQDERHDYVEQLREMLSTK